MRQLPVGTEQRVEICKLFFVRQLTEEQKIDCFFKTKTLLGSKAPDKIINVNSTVVELTVDWYGDTIYLLGGDDCGDLCKACQNSLAV